MRVVVVKEAAAKEVVESEREGWEQRTQRGRLRTLPHL